MTAPSLTWAQILALKPCDPAPIQRRLEAAFPDYDVRALTMADGAAAGVDIDDLIWLAARVDERKTRLFAADCAARVSHLAPDPRSRAAIVAARAFARGQITPEDLKA